VSFTAFLLKTTSFVPMKRHL